MLLYLLVLFMLGLLLSAAYDDLSNHRFANHRPAYGVSNDLYNPSNAVDRNITTCMRTAAIGQSSVFKKMWWQVDLGRLYNIYSIEIIFKNYNNYEMRQRGRFAGFSLYVSETNIMDETSLCYKDGPSLPFLNFSITCITFGSYVTFYNERLDGVIYQEEYEVESVFTELCEVFVYGCKRSGVYGSNCDVPCPINCRYNTCHILNGTCFGCPPGWAGTTCNKKCTEGWYGLDCKQQCSGHCIYDLPCNHVTGVCDGGCAAGWRGSLCHVEQIDLSYTKAATQSPLYLGTYYLYKAENAVDRNITTCMRTEIIGRNSPAKTMWWMVDLGGMYYINSVRISFKHYDGYEMRQRGRFAGFSLYVSTNGIKDNSTPCYKDGPNLPFLDFITNCIGYGRYVTFYNERLDGISYPTGYEASVYTELCEVTVYGCDMTGFYGNKCEKACPENCKDSICNIKKGTCLFCESGWSGINCSIECGLGWHGHNCKEQCSRNCENNTCNHVTGHCDKGCIAGWTGSLCEEECVQSYGENCKFSCSPHCFDRKCDRFNGSCLTNCTDDFYGEKCDIFSNHRADSIASRCSWDIGGPIFMTITIIFLIGVSITIWGICTKKFSITFNMRKVVKNNLYAEAEVTPDNASHYQELGTPERSTYQNTTLC